MMDVYFREVKEKETSVEMQDTGAQYVSFRNLYFLEVRHFIKLHF